MKDEYLKYYKTIGKNIKTLRKSKKWSQDALASRCNKVDRAKISAIENANEDYMLSTLLDVCLALNTDVHAITKETEDEPDSLA